MNKRCPACGKLTLRPAKIVKTDEFHRVADSWSNRCIPVGCSDTYECQACSWNPSWKIVAIFQRLHRFMSPEAAYLVELLTIKQKTSLAKNAFEHFSTIGLKIIQNFSSNAKTSKEKRPEMPSVW